MPVVSYFLYVNNDLKGLSQICQNNGFCQKYVFCLLSSLFLNINIMLSSVALLKIKTRWFQLPVEHYYKHKWNCID